MKYDRVLLQIWATMDSWEDYLKKNGGLTNRTSQEGFNHIQTEYFSEVKRRIVFCKELLKDHEDAFLNYVIAKLYNNYDLNESPTFLYKRPVKYYCLRALEIDPNFTLASDLLQEANEWVSFIGGDSGGNIMPEVKIEFRNKG